MVNTTDREWVEHYNRCRRRAQIGSVTRLSAGQYFTRNQEGLLMTITRIDEGCYRGQWLVELEALGAHSDPIATLGEAREIAWNWS